MKITFLSIALLLSGIIIYNTLASKNKPMPMDMNTQPQESIYNFKIKSLDGKLVDFSTFKGKKILIVNTASECGYTPQFTDLQKLHAEYGGKIAILGFPSNDFGGQEPGTNQSIESFCKKNYGVSFQMFEKIAVKGNQIHPLYQWLTDKNKNGWNIQGPTWNFCKYLINEKGELVKFLDSKVSPMSQEIIQFIEQK